jgi:hypothetical protein
LLPFAEDLDPARIHVQEPYTVVFLCGGQCTSLNDPEPRSLRDAFLKAIDNPIMEEGEWLRAEEVTQQTGFFDSYTDILVFETDLAQIVKLIVLFCESEGSSAELGAFTAIDEILERLFVIVRERHWREDSFIKLGPLRRIERKVGRGAIQVVADEDVGIVENQIAMIDKKALVDQLHEPLAARLKEPKEPSTFDPSRAGHVIKLIVGLVQEYGALTFEEILSLLKSLNVEKRTEDIRGYLLCAKSVGWLLVSSRGANDYFIQTGKGADAATFHMKDGAKEKNKMRRRTTIREHWQKNDKPRFGAMQAVRAE